MRPQQRRRSGCFKGADNRVAGNIQSMLLLLLVALKIVHHFNRNIYIYIYYVYIGGGEGFGKVCWCYERIEGVGAGTQVAGGILRYR